MPRPRDDHHTWPRDLAAGLGLTAVLAAAAWIGWHAALWLL